VRLEMGRQRILAPPQLVLKAGLVVVRVRDVLIAGLRRLYPCLPGQPSPARRSTDL
jgi:hypothetical protein